VGGVRGVFVVEVVVVAVVVELWIFLCESNTHGILKASS